MDHKVYLGTISHATMRPEDLIPAFITELERIDQENKYTKVIEEGQDIINRGDWDSENTSYYLNETLFDALNDFAPSHTNFGSHPGDGSDYGFWPYENIQDDFEGLKVSNLSEIPKDYEGEVLLVTDSGDMALYNITNGTRKEIWLIT